MVLEEPECSAAFRRLLHLAQGVLEHFEPTVDDEDLPDPLLPAAVVWAGTIVGCVPLAWYQRLGQRRWASTETARLAGELDLVQRRRLAESLWRIAVDVADEDEEAPFHGWAETGFAQGNELVRFVLDTVTETVFIEELDETTGPLCCEEITDYPPRLRCALAEWAAKNHQESTAAILRQGGRLQKEDVPGLLAISRARQGERGAAGHVWRLDPEAAVNRTAELLGKDADHAHEWFDEAPPETQRQLLDLLCQLDPDDRPPWTNRWCSERIPWAGTNSQRLLQVALESSG